MPDDRQALVGHRTRCYYEVVTLNGHGVHARVEGPLAEAQRVAEAKAAAALVDFGPWEIQQVFEYDGGSSFRYFMRSGSRWVPWSHDGDFDVRQPDWWRPSAAAVGQEREPSDG